LKYFLTSGRVLSTIFSIRSEPISRICRLCNRHEEIGRAKQRSCVLHTFGRMLSYRLPSSGSGYKSVTSTWTQGTKPCGAIQFG
jgi:hypothetical protein